MTSHDSQHRPRAWSQRANRGERYCLVKSLSGQQLRRVSRRRLRLRLL